MQLTERYRPASWDEVVGQEKVVARIKAIALRGLGRRALWLSGASGTGKTTIARLVAREPQQHACDVTGCRVWGDASMKENVFYREESDGSITVHSPFYDVSATAPTMRMATDKFIREMRAKYPNPLIVVAADPE
jgi:DNA polymerase III delta prime subunit